MTMASLKERVFVVAASVMLASLSISTASATVIAGWAQNSNFLPDPPGGFGFLASDFPQAADVGSGSYDIAGFDTTADIFGVLENVASFSGTSTNDLTSQGSGGSFAFRGDTSNGASGAFTVPTTGFQDIEISWAQRGTSTGYTDRTFEYSIDGGVTFVDVPFAGDSGALTSSWTTVNIDLSSVAGLDDNPSAVFRITYDGATSGSGNNRWDNFYVEGTVVPEPTGLILAATGLLTLNFRKRTK